MPAAALTTVTLTLQCRPAVFALDHVGMIISSFVDGSMMIPLAQACSFRSTRLLDRIWERSDPEADKGTGWSLCQYLRTDIHYYRFQFTKSLRAAVESGDLHVVRWVLEHFSGCIAEKEVVEEAARCGRLDVLKYFLEYERSSEGERNVILWGGNDMVLAIQGGHGELAKWLYENTPNTSRNLENVMECAVRQGDRMIIEWLLAVVYKAELALPPPSMNDAAAGGHMEILQWLFEQNFGGSSDCALEGAAKNGRLDMVKWLVKKGITKGSREAVQAACGEGHLEVVQWLLEHGEVHYPQFAVTFAIRRGHLDIVKYLHDVGIAYNPSRMMIDAASCGHLHVMKWFLLNYGVGPLFQSSEASHGGRSKSNAMDRAASNGHLRMLKFLHSVAVEMHREGKSGYPSCSESALLSAATRGHFEVVKWLCSTYPQLNFPPTTTSMVAYNGHLQMLQWLHHQDNVEWSSDAFDLAAENGHLGVVKWLHENRNEGCTTSAMNYAARNGHLKVVRWLHRNRMEGCTVDALNFAVHREHFEVLLFLKSKYTDGCSTAAKMFTRGHQQQHIIEWLNREYPLPKNL